MTYERERYLDDSGVWHVSLQLRSRSGPMHSLLTSLTPEERAAVTDALTAALDAILPVLRRRLEEPKS